MAGTVRAGAAHETADAMRLLQRNCLGCHNAEKNKGGVNLSSRAAALKGGDEGPAVVPRKPGKSRLLEVLSPDSDPHMPPKKQLKAAEIELLKRWVSNGAKWDEETLARASRPREVAIAAPHPGLVSVYALALTEDGSRLAVGRGSRIQVFDGASTNASPIAEWSAHTEFVRSLAWSQDGKRLASGSFRQVALWEDGRAVWKKAISDGDRVTAVRFLPGSGDLVVADGSMAVNGRISILDVATGQSKTNWLAHADLINDLSLSADGKLLATAGADRLAKVWELASGKEVARLEGHSGAVNGVALKADGSELATVGADKLLSVWDVKTREGFVSMPERKQPLTALAWPADGKAALVVDEAGALWSYSDFKRHTGAQSSDAAQERKLKDWPSALHMVAASADGKTIAVAGEDGVVRVVDETGKEKLRLDPPAITPTPEIVEAAPPKKRPQKSPPAEPDPSFVRDVLPALAKAGCMAGSCHAKPEGQNGFKLSVFSFDPKSDYQEITREGRARRVFPAAPEESLLLLKPTGILEHGGGERFSVGSDTYLLLTRWIRAGMPYQLTNEPTLVRITVDPAERVYKKNAGVPLAVKAHYSDGSARVVTQLAEYAANDKEIAQVTEDGVIRAGDLSGETVVVARYMGQVAASRVTIPADRRLPPAKYATLATNNFIDALAHQHFQRLGLFPSGLSSDSEFLRRSTLDAIGRLPTLEETRAFLGDQNPKKRQAWIDHLLADPAYADYWANKWADLFRPNPDRVGVKSIFTLDQWLRESFRANKPFDQFAHEILTAEGSNHRDGPAVIYRDRREAPERTTMFSQVFLGTRMECARCHHHPNEKWSQDDFYQFAAFFGPLKQKGAGLSPPISAGTESFYYQAGAGTVSHPVTGEKMQPRPLDGPLANMGDKTDPRFELADWLVNPRNPFFARAAVNRVWAVYFGRGFVEPVDDFRVSNPIVNEPLLQALAADFVGQGYDLKKLMRTIMNSRLYQLSSTPGPFNLADTKNFSRSYRRRLPAEALLDAVNDVLGATDPFSGCPPDTRAMQTWSYKTSSHFLDAFSRPNASSDCPCERDLKTSVVQSLHMMNAKNLQEKLGAKEGRAKKLADSQLTPGEIVRELYLAAYCRAPSEKELKIATGAFAAEGATRQSATEDVLWALLNAPEFVFNH